jgi:putative spermidine/putrescine transport system ATP-binding protein
VFLDGVDVTAVPAERRGIGMVFQSYALFPHLTVEDNVAFGLRVRGLARARRRELAREALALVRLESLALRSVATLSGGEQQRVALARALAFQPRALLLDEPLSALDAKLRESLRGELFRLLKELRITTVYVTHDQTEAMSLGKDLLVLSGGRLVQSGAPRDVYARPRNSFVADFLGGANLWKGECVGEPGRMRVRLAFAELELSDGERPGPCWAMVRPEALEVVPDSDCDFRARLDSAFFLGSHVRMELTAAGEPLVVEVRDPGEVDFGASVPLKVRRDKICVWPRTEEEEEGAARP